MGRTRLPNAMIAGLVALGTIGAFGPHLAMLAFRAVGARPPGALLFLCVLSHNNAPHANGRVTVSPGWDTSRLAIPR